MNKHILFNALMILVFSINCYSQNNDSYNRNKHSRDYFLIGSNKDEVLEIQGQPKRISDIDILNKETWYYDEGIVEFVNGKVKEFTNYNGELKVRIKSNKKSLFEQVAEHENEISQKAKKEQIDPNSGLSKESGFNNLPGFKTVSRTLKKDEETYTGGTHNKFNPNEEKYDNITNPNPLDDETDKINGLIAQEKKMQLVKIVGSIIALVLTVFIVTRYKSKFKDTLKSKFSFARNFYDFFKNKMNLGIFRILILVGIFCSCFLSYNSELGNANIFAFILISLIVFLCYWGIVRLVIWVFDGFQNQNKD